MKPGNGEVAALSDRARRSRSTLLKLHIQPQARLDVRRNALSDRARRSRSTLIKLYIQPQARLDIRRNASSDCARRSRSTLLKLYIQPQARRDVRRNASSDRARRSRPLKRFIEVVILLVTVSEVRSQISANCLSSRTE